jgi:DNA-binding beta-propeller fold protein YncE
MIFPRLLPRTAAQIIVLVCVTAAGLAQGAEDPTQLPRFVLEWGEQGADHGQFDFPIGIAINAADEVRVTDFKNARVQKFSSQGTFLAQFAVSPFPGGIALDGAGNVYVAHAGIPPERFDEPRKRDKIAVFNAAGKPLREWGKFGTGDGEFDMPGGIAVSPEGRVYVADQCNRRIQVFDTHGKFLTKWGKKGFATGEFGGNPHPKAFFAGPTFVVCDREGNVYTTEAPLGRVQKFTRDGRFLLSLADSKGSSDKFGGNSKAFRSMRGPTGMCFDAQGRLWINAICGRLQQFSSKGTLLVRFGEEGTKSGQFRAPHGLAIDSHGCLYVVDSYNHRIQKFAVRQP